MHHKPHLKYFNVRPLAKTKTKMPTQTQTQTQAGFTLVEAILVMLILGIVSTIAAKFITTPIEQYQDQTRRAELSNIADTALRRMSRDIRLALPNSLRNPNSNCIEFVPTFEGGRYRADQDSNGAGKAFTADQPITQFDVIGNLTTLPVAGDYVAVYNLGISGADIYEGSNRTTITSATTHSLNFVSKNFLLASPANRFHLISQNQQAVSFVCEGAGIGSGNGTGKLYRIWKYGFNYPAPNTCVNSSTSGVQKSLLAENIAYCNMVFDAGISQRISLFNANITIQKNNESVTLYHAVNIENIP